MGKQGRPRVPASNHNGQSKAQLIERLRSKHAQNQGEKTICLTMIVKNEAKNMPRLLNSVKSIIDMVSIVDTGSTDDTISVIKKWGTENNIPTTVHQEPFQDFAYNRTHSVQMAQKTYPQADYLLLSDADFVWEVNVNMPFNKKLLYDHKYMVEQYNTTLRYWNVRLLAAKVQWLCVGLTHEYWVENKKEYEGEVRTQKIRTLVINDLEDGGCKGDKFERDERLLKRGIADSETPPDLKRRYRFYLAQTLRDLKKYEESIALYEERIADGGWEEEIYYSKYQIGQNYERLAWIYQYIGTALNKAEKEQKELTETEKTHNEQWNTHKKNGGEMAQLAEETFQKARNAYTIAHKYRPIRAEAIYAHTRMLRMLSKHQEAYDLAIEGKKITYPNDSLFLEYGCYSYLFDYELSIVCFYVKELKSLGQQACERLLQRTDLPAEVRDRVEKNCGFYL